MIKRIRGKNNLNAAFVGLTHVGVVCSSCWASLGNKSTGFDKNKDLINSLNSGKLLLAEPGLEELYNKNRKNISFSSNFPEIKNFDLIFITYDTELTGNDRLKNLNNLIDYIIPNLGQNTTIILMSQVPVGYCRELSNKIKTANPNLKFNLIHWIDTIIMTQAVNSFLNPSRITLGFGEKPFSIPRNLQEVLGFFECPVMCVSWESAEITKAATNLYLAASVTFADTISDFCETTGANMDEVIPALRLDRRIGQYAYIKPSTGIAGGHLERDIEMFKKLSQEKKMNTDFIDCIAMLNEKRFNWVVDKIEKLSLKKGSNICIWGLSYKPISDSTLNAPSLKIIQSLKRKYNINVYDPMAKLNKEIKDVKQTNDKYGALKGSDCLIILTAWEEFNTTDFKKIAKLMRRKNIIDCTGLWKTDKESSHITKLIVMGNGSS